MITNKFGKALATFLQEFSKDYRVYFTLAGVPAAYEEGYQIANYYRGMYGYGAPMIARILAVMRCIRGIENISKLIDILEEAHDNTQITLTERERDGFMILAGVCESADLIKYFEGSRYKQCERAADIAQAMLTGLRIDEFKRTYIDERTPDYLAERGIVFERY